MRLLVVAVVCLAVGIGAGWLISERPWQATDDAETFTIASVERATANAFGPGVREVSCASDHGPFYSCRAYVGVNRGADYAITVAHNGRCLTATRHDQRMEESALDNLDSDAFEHDTGMPPKLRAWLVDRSDC